MLLTLLTACLNPTLYAPDAHAASGDYSLGGSLYIQVYKDPSTIAAALAHDHIVQAKGWTGTASFDPDNLADCKMDISVPVSSLVVDAEGIRKQMGYDTFPSESEREDIRKEMLSSDQLDAKKYPTITWKSSKCQANGERVDMTGTLTIHGVSKELTIPMTVKVDELSFHAKGATAIRATQFGFDPFSAGFGALKNQDRMLLAISVHGKP